jgi:hypothetical protein
MPLHDGISIGLLLNTKGIIELVILNIGKNKKIMSDQSFTVLVFMSALITALVTPLLAMVVKPARRLVCSTSDGPSRGRSPTRSSTCWPASTCPATCWRS